MRYGGYKLENYPLISIFAFSLISIYKDMNIVQIVNLNPYPYMFECENKVEMTIYTPTKHYVSQNSDNMRISCTRHE